MAVRNNNGEELKVIVVMPAYNAAQTLKEDLMTIYRRSWWIRSSCDDVAKEKSAGCDRSDRRAAGH